ncbi:MAG: hypothetical protein LUH05_03935 [Candidatus Gastranaerophilales bacterium]|nr:hypothetical protein [Candidatus Gastranaerophilales bacterium]
MALHTWEEGENIYAEYLNGNNDYILDTLNTKTSALESTLEADVSSLTDKIDANTTSIETLETEFDEISDTLSSAISGILANIAPKYSSATNISSGWTATSYGWVSWSTASSQGSNSVTAYLRVNGVEVGYHYHYKYGNSYRMQYLVSKGDVITFTNSTAKFFPCKGA